MLSADMEKGVGGGIVQGDGYKPSADGSLICLNGGDYLSMALSKVEKAGGKNHFTKDINRTERLYGSFH